MEARELRIDNWAKQDRANVQVTGAMIQEINQELLDIEPIPLTEEWLLKFGFEKMTKGYCFHNGSFGLFFDNGILQLETPVTSIELNHIKFVHQYQNLYFALTCEELTIKQS